MAGADTSPSGQGPQAQRTRQTNLVRFVEAAAGIIVLVGLIWSAYLIFAEERPAYLSGWIFLLSVLAMIGLGALITTSMDYGLWGKSASAYTAALVWTAIAVNGIAAIITVTAYIAQYNTPPPWNQRLNDLAVLIGAISALTVWPMLALICSRSAAADRANTRAYAAILSRLSEINAELNALAQFTSDFEKDALKHIAYKEVTAHRDFIARQLGQKLVPIGGGPEYSLELSEEGPDTGLRWVLATGYIDLWNRIHRAEEALILLEPREMVIGEALHDEFRILDSGIKTEKDLVIQLQGVRAFLSTFHSFEPIQFENRLPGALAPTTPQREAQPGTGLSADQQVQAEREARDVVRHVRRVLNEFRDDSREGLVVTRNRLIRTGTLCGLTSYVLMALAIVMGAPVQGIVAASAFFLVGAIINLFNQLRLEAQSDKAVDDYGLSTARMVHRPLFSGLAAIGGVVFVAFVTDVMINSQSPSTRTIDVANGGQSILSLIFDLKAFPFSLILAAVFGLTPDLLVLGLREQTEQLKRNLQVTTASGSGDARQDDRSWRYPRSGGRS